MYFPLKAEAVALTSSIRRDAVQETGTAQPLLREGLHAHTLFIPCFTFPDFYYSRTQEALDLSLQAARSAKSGTTDCTGVLHRRLVWLRPTALVTKISFAEEDPVIPFP